MDRSRDDNKSQQKRIIIPVAKQLMTLSQTQVGSKLDSQADRQMEVTSGRQINGQTDTKTHKQAGKYTDTQTAINTGSEPNRQMCRQADKETY